MYVEVSGSAFGRGVLLNMPVVRQVLQDFQENPQAAQRHTKSPMIMEKLQKLINAGIVRQG